MTQTMFHQIFSWSYFQPLASSFKHKNALQSFILKTNKPTKYFLDSQLLVVLVPPVLHFLCSQTSWKSSSCSQSPCSSPPVHCPHSFLIATAVTTATFSLPWPLFGTCHYWQFVFLKTRFIWLLWYSCLLVFFFALYCLICDLFLNAHVSEILTWFQLYLTLNFPCSGFLVSRSSLSPACSLFAHIGTLPNLCWIQTWNHLWNTY